MTQETQEFKATHIITHNKRRILVCLVDSACYTRAEWETSSLAVWEWDDRTGLIFQGGTPSGQWFFDDVKQ